MICEAFNNVPLLFMGSLKEFINGIKLSLLKDVYKHILHIKTHLPKVTIY